MKVASKEHSSGRDEFDFRDFLTFCLLIERYLPGPGLYELAERYKTQPMNIFVSGFLLYAAPLTYAKNIDDAFRISGKIVQVTRSDKPDPKALSELAKEFPLFSDSTLQNNTSPYIEFVRRLKDPRQETINSKDKPQLQAIKLTLQQEFKSSLLSLAEVWFSDLNSITNTQNNRWKIAGIDPILLDIFDEKRRERGLSATIMPMELGTKKTSSQASKIADRSVGYMVDRAAAEFDNINGIQLQSLHRREEKKGDITYVHYYESHGGELIREVRLSDAAAHFGVYYSSDRGEAQKAQDTPMKKLPGALFEATGCMVHQDGDPTEVLAIQGEIKQPKIHPAHDGILLIGADGIPHIEHIESINGALLGRTGSINAKYADRDLFAQKIQDLKLTAMQAPLLMKDGKPLSITTTGVPWNKRAFVTFSNGEHGFIESKQPIDQRTFSKILIDAKVQDAIALDTGYYDRYVDATGESSMGEKVNPVMLYAQKR